MAGNETPLVTIEATARTGSGKNFAHKLRKAGKIPGTLMSKGKTTLIELDPKLLPKAVKAGNRFLLTFEGATREVKIQELQINPVKRYAFSVDLMPV